MPCIAKSETSYSAKFVEFVSDKKSSSYIVVQISYQNYLFDGVVSKTLVELNTEKMLCIKRDS